MIFLFLTKMMRMLAHYFFNQVTQKVLFLVEVEIAIFLILWEVKK
jgi:hypothetical protein